MAQLPRQLKCVLLFPSSEGGDWGCIPSNGNKDASVNIVKNGIRLSFPRDPDRSVWAWYSPDLTMTDSRFHHVTIELPPNGFNAASHPLTFDEVEIIKKGVPNAMAYDNQMMKITLQEESQVIGFGTPFHGANETVDGWINQGSKICGVTPLSEILQMKEFTLLVEATEAHLEKFVSNLKIPRNPEAFGYGEVYVFSVL